jgi:hypothetical protein
MLPQTGFDYTNRGEMVYFQRIFLTFGATLTGLGLVFKGIENQLKANAKKEE